MEKFFFFEPIFDLVLSREHLRSGLIYPYLQLSVHHTNEPNAQDPENSPHIYTRVTRAIGEKQTQTLEFRRVTITCYYGVMII